MNLFSTQNRSAFPSRRLQSRFARATGRLSVKIFLAFWAAMTLAGIAMLAAENTRTVKLAERWRSVTDDALSIYASSAAQSLEDPRTWSAREFLGNLEKRTSIRAWLFDDKGRELSGYAVPQRNQQPLWIRQRLRTLIDKARASDHSQFDELNQLMLVARATHGPSSRLYVLAGVLPTRRYGPWQAEPDIQAVRLVAIFVIAGVVSLALARHLTQPLGMLRAATQQLAEGEFSARANLGLARHDELGELAHDFNHMAGRIETLLKEQQRLVAAQRRLLADVAHELRSPLARAGVALELARDALWVGAGHSEKTQSDSADFAVDDLPEDLRAAGEALARIERENGRLTELIDRLLVLSRLESGVIQPEWAPVDMVTLVKSIAADADFEARPAKRVSYRIECDECILSGTQNLLCSAVENVVRNAVYHAPEGTTVEITLTREVEANREGRWQCTDLQDGCFTSPMPDSTVGIWAVVAIRDRGAGIPEAELGEVFQPFYRARGRAVGVGLGLSITARAIELHGGQFRVCNLPEGGLLVELRLPMEEDVPEAEE